MNKIELNTLTQVNNNERNFLTALNDNLKRIQAAINDTLSRSGVSPNQMEEVLDMNGKRIVNVGPAVNPTDVVTRQDIQNIIDAANAAIAQLDRLVEDGKIALMNYASEYIYPTCTAAVDACQLAQRKSEDAQGAAEAARDALLLNTDYQAIVANLTTILALVNDIANLDAIAADLTNIDTVAGISSAVSAVADNAENINAVNANKTNIDTVAGDKANIDTVAGNTSNINTVAGISSAVTTLAGISATLTALNNNLTAINGVYDDLSKIESVYTALPEVEAVYAALSDIGAVADALTAISSVAAALTTLANIEDNLMTLLAVGADLTNLDSLAADLTNLDSIANNLTEILQASTYASQAAASASNAQIWAEGTDQQVVPLGGQHSAKVWAQYIEEIIAGTRIYGGTFDSTTAIATLTSSAKAKLGVTSDSIVLTNDSTAVTGYAANEGIEYYVAVDGTFASLTLHEGDILWSTGSAWKKIDNAATEIPDATESVKGIAALASTAEAEAGVNDTKVMTPLKTKQAILELAPAPADASESTKGIIELASEGEATAGSNDTKAMTPLKTKQAIQGAFLEGTTAPTTTTAGFVGQNYLDTVTGKSYVCTVVTPHQTPTSTHYTTEGYTYSYDSTTGILSQTSNYAGASVLLNPSIDITGKSFEFVSKIYPSNTGLYSLGNAFSTTNPNTYDHALIDYAVRNKWGWFKLVGVANGTNSTLYWIQDSGYTRETLPTTGWTTLSTTAVFNGGNPIIGRGYSSYASVLSMSGAKVDLINSYIIVNGVTYNFVDLETTYTYTWEELANASDIKVYTAGTGINISSDTVAATAMTGADGTNAGTLGAVPAPAATDNTKFLRGDGTWAVAAQEPSYNSSSMTIQL